MIVAMNNSEFPTIFVSEEQKDGTWLQENCDREADRWSSLIFGSRFGVLGYHAHYGDDILHDDG